MYAVTFIFSHYTRKVDHQVQGNCCRNIGKVALLDRHTC